MKVIENLVPGVIIGVVAMMLLPLPNAVLDFLLVANIGFSISLLLSCATLIRPERFTVLPSVILLSTLFRLGLNISTTRQLLSTGEAPEIVSAFGLFVVGGNLLVGIVIFLIITVVQFIVISKGAERVAEVAARFTLDAMPGKQMSIDADLRAGALSLAEARERRVELQRESRLYGSLDGAMKFIKGDAISGLFITAINIVAGIILGSAMHGLDLSEAARRYTLFTVGDGLVSQIPALLVSIAAGLAVTRVADRGESTIGEELFGQIAREPRVPLITAGLLFILCFLPGLPVIPLGVFCFISLLAAGLVPKAVAVQNQDFKPRGAAPLTLVVSESALKELQGSEHFVKSVQQLRKFIFREWGIVLPEPELEVDANEKRNLAVLNRYGSPLFNIDCKAGELAENVLKNLKSAFLSRLRDFIDDTQTRLILDAHESRCEDLINYLIPSQITVTKLTKIIRCLVEERIPVKDLAAILQGISEARLLEGLGQMSSETLLYMEIREKLKRTITSLLSSNGEIKVITLCLELERLLERVSIGAAILDPELAVKIKLAVQEQVLKSSSKILLCEKHARVILSPLFQDLDIYVVARGEIEEGTEIEISSEVSIQPHPLLRAA